MHRSRCIVVSAMGGFKINGPPKNGKGPMSQGNNLGTRDKASLPQPTQAGRIDACTELISKAMRCLGNNDKDYVMRKIEELVRADCHNGYAVGREIADKVKDVVHELWIISNHEEMRRLLMMLRDLNISRNWVRDALGMNTKTLDKWLVRCGIDWESKAIRNDIVKVIESLLREKFGWSETRMCEKMWQFVGVDVDEFRKYGMEPCIWLKGLEELSNLKHPYWLGLRASDLTVKELDDKIRLKLDTTNAIDAIFFLKILSAIKAPSLKIEWKRGAPAAKYASKSINLTYYIDLSANAWPWPIEFSVSELKRILDGFSDEELAEFIAGAIDGDGIVWYNYGNIFVRIVACRDCPKRMVLDVLKEVIARRFGIVGTIYHFETADALEFGGEKAARLLRRIVKYIHHPLKKLRAELILALYDGRISPEKFEELYDVTKYERRAPDIKRNNGLDVLVRAAPQTHTHGEPNTKTKTENTK